MSKQEDKYKRGQCQTNTNEGQMKAHSRASVNKNRWREGGANKGGRAKGGRAVVEAGAAAAATTIAAPPPFFHLASMSSSKQINILLWWLSTLDNIKIPRVFSIVNMSRTVVCNL